MFTLAAILKMDLRGIEPLSESLSLAVSPITVAVLTFPWQYAHRQAYCFSSFMIHLPVSDTHLDTRKMSELWHRPCFWRQLNVDLAVA